MQRTGAAALCAHIAVRAAHFAPCPARAFALLRILTVLSGAANTMRLARDIPSMENASAVRGSVTLPASLFRIPFLSFAGAWLLSLDAPERQ